VAPPHSSISFGVRIASLGLASYAIEPDLESAWTIGGVWRFFPDDEQMPGGFFFGPRVEFGASTTTDYTSTIYGGAADIGYRWLLGRGFMIGLGGQVGAFASDFEHKSDKSDTGTILYIFAMGVFSVGIAF
jgi:hypothetical protein